MSGPKVINIEAVRRRQKRESLLQLRKLELVLADCERLEVQPQAATMLERLNGLSRTAQWGGLLVEAEPLCRFYEEEAERLRQGHAAEQSARFRHAHRLQQSIAHVAAQLRALSPSRVADDLINLLASTDPASQESALNAAVRFLEKSQNEASASDLKEIAARLMDADSSVLAPALPQAPADPHEERLDKCWKLLGELSALDDSPDIRAFFDKANRITTAAASQQPLLLDSLVLELSTHLQNRRAGELLRKQIQILLTELEEVRSPAAAEWRQHLNETLKHPLSLEAAREQVSKSRAWIEKTILEETHAEQRATVLRALAASGYEVREGMATAWVEQGRLVLRKPNESTYGIELSAPAQGSAVQTRVVALVANGRDPLRDKEVEESWCGEFERARAEMNEEGFQTNLVHAFPAGSIPLKTVDIASSDHENFRRQEAVIAVHKTLQG